MRSATKRTNVITQKMVNQATKTTATKIGLNSKKRVGAKDYSYLVMR